MGLLDIFSKEKRAEDDTLDLVDDVILKALLTGEQIDARKALTIPAVASAVNRISTLVAILPIKLYKKEPTTEDEEGQEKKTEIIDDKRLYLLNVDSGDTLDQFAIKRNLAKDYLLEKGGFLYIQGRSSDPKALKYIPPRQITAIINDVNPIQKDGRYLVIGQQYEQFDFVSVLRDTEDGFLGVPLTKQINDVLATAFNNTLYELGIVKKGGSKKGFLQSEKVLDKDAMSRLKTAWKQLYANTSENVVVLNAGLKFQEANDTAREMQVNERKKTLHDELTEVFGIHSTKFDDIFRDAVLPVLEAIESALNKSLLLEKEKKTHFFAFDKREVVKAELQTRYEAYKIASETGWLSKNEIRKAENLEPIEGMDVVSMGLGDVIYDVKTKEYFTPNTGNTKKFDENGDDLPDNSNNKDEDDDEEVEK